MSSHAFIIGKYCILFTIRWKFLKSKRDRDQKQSFRVFSLVDTTTSRRYHIQVCKILDCCKTHKKASLYLYTFFSTFSSLFFNLISVAVLDLYFLALSNRNVWSYFYTVDTAHFPLQFWAMRFSNHFDLNKLDLESLVFKLEGVSTRWLLIICCASMSHRQNTKLTPNSAPPQKKKNELFRVIFFFINRIK